MALTRKRKRELKRLKGEAGDVWGEQREVLDQAAKLLRNARRVASNLAREEVAPRVQNAYEHRLAPVVNTSVSASRKAADSTRKAFVDGVLPAVSAAVGSTIAAIDVSRDPHIRDALRHVRDASSKLAHKVSPVPPPKRGPGVGGYVLIGVGVLAVAAVGYALWQTLSADDDLWIDDEPAPSPAV